MTRKYIVEQGIFDGAPWKKDGYFHVESREYFPLPVKFRELLNKKYDKFKAKYGITKIPFTIGTISSGNIKAIAICHTKFDEFKEEIGESIVIGRLKRTLGLIPKREPYNLVVRHRIKHSNGGITAGDLKYPFIYNFGR